METWGPAFLGLLSFLRCANNLSYFSMIPLWLQWEMSLDHKFCISAKNCGYRPQVVIIVVKISTTCQQPWLWSKERCGDFHPAPWEFAIVYFATFEVRPAWPLVAKLECSTTWAKEVQPDTQIPQPMAHGALYSMGSASRSWACILSREIDSDVQRGFQVSQAGLQKDDKHLAVFVYSFQRTMRGHKL